ncbi:MAG TPA: response regulator [Spirochaetia bacterium]|nr:response regulator [Spirochaetia bacterium]
MATNPLADLFERKRADLEALLVSHLQSAAFDNPYTLHPRRLAELGREIVERLCRFLDSPNRDEAMFYGQSIAGEGIAEKTVVLLVATLHRFRIEQLSVGGESALALFDNIDSFVSPFLEGFMKARESQILKDQEQLRRALSTALQNQGHELLIKEHAISTSINGIMLTDLAGKVTYVNPSFLSLWGFDSAREVIGARFEDFWVSAEAREIAHILPVSGGWRGELVARRRDQSNLTVELSASLICDERGQAVGVMTSFVDVTERKRLQAQVIQAQKMEAIGQLAGGIAHDFNNLLAVISGYLQLVMNDAPRDSQQYRDLMQIAAAVDRGTALTGQLRFFTRQTAGTRQVVSLNDIAHETLQLVKHTFPPQIVIDLSLTRSSVNIEADPNQVSQVLINLCMNARDAMTDPARKTAAGHLIIETSTVELSESDASRYANARRGKFAVLRVRDTGVGIPPELMERLFIPFVTTKAARSGTGLGLAVVYGIVAGHHGFVNVSSVVGKGAVFEVFLPISGRQIEASKKERVEPDLTTGHGAILVADDDPQVREVVTRILEGCGYSVIAAQDGEEALARFSDGVGIDLVVLDFVMPGMGGRECLRRMKKIDPRARVLILTAHITDGSAQELLSEGALEVIEKPFNQWALVATIQNALAGKT